MAFNRIDLLSQYDVEKRKRVRARWTDSDDGRALHSYILEKVRQGAGEDFLQWDFESGKLGFLEDYWDLAGFEMFSEEIEFPRGDNFEDIDFSYASMWHCRLVGAAFPQTYFAFAKFYNGTFKDCLFAFTSFHGCTLEKCRFENCDFVDYNGFDNSDFQGCSFENCYISRNIFKDCCFDENVIISNIRKPLILGLLNCPNDFNDKLELDQITAIYRGIKDGFLSGEIFNKARRYFFLQRQAYTRFNDKGKIYAYAWEFVAGYGTRRLRVLGIAFVMFVVAMLCFWHKLDLDDSIILTAGAFLTFGAKTELLDKMPIFYKLLYIFAAFVGVSSVALFITVLASVLLKEN
jgi:hypothetical protein